MPDKKLSDILAQFNDDYLSSTRCLKLIDQAFLTFTSTESFGRRNDREELSKELLALHERLGELFTYLSEQGNTQLHNDPII